MWGKVASSDKMVGFGAEWLWETGVWLSKEELFTIAWNSECLLWFSC